MVVERDEQPADDTSASAHGSARAGAGAHARGRRGERGLDPRRAWVAVVDRRNRRADAARTGHVAGGWAPPGDRPRPPPRLDRRFPPPPASTGHVAGG